jgi:hypothetical protein
MPLVPANVCFGGMSGHQNEKALFPLLTQLRHWPRKIAATQLDPKPIALIHRLRKLFQKFPETVRNWLWKTKIVLRL